MNEKTSDDVIEDVIFWAKAYVFSVDRGAGKRTSDWLLKQYIEATRAWLELDDE